MEGEEEEEGEEAASDGFPAVWGRVLHIEIHLWFFMIGLRGLRWYCPLNKRQVDGNVFGQRRR